MKDPVRLVADPSYPEEQRALLREGQALDPPPGAEDQVWRSLAAAIGGAAATTTAAAPAATAAVRGGGALKMGLVAVAALALGAGGLSLWWVMRGDAGRRHAEPIPVVAPAPAPTPAAPVPPAPVAPAVPRSGEIEGSAPERPPPAAPVPLPRLPHAARVGVPHPPAPERAAPPDEALGPPPVAPSPPPVAPSPPPSPPVAPEPAVSAAAASHLGEEVALMKRARQALRDREPGRALAILDESRRRFPAAVLEQERERLTIQTLAAAGRGAEASARAAAFLRAYPDSPHAGEIRGLVR